MKKILFFKLFEPLTFFEQYFIYNFLYKKFTNLICISCGKNSPQDVFLSVDECTTEIVEGFINIINPDIIMTFDLFSSFSFPVINFISQEVDFIQENENILNIFLSYSLRKKFYDEHYKLIKNISVEFPSINNSPSKPLVENKILMLWNKNYSSEIKMFDDNPHVLCLYDTTCVASKKISLYNQDYLGKNNYVFLFEPTILQILFFESKYKLIYIVDKKGVKIYDSKKEIHFEDIESISGKYILNLKRVLIYKVKKIKKLVSKNVGMCKLVMKEDILTNVVIKNKINIIISNENVQQLLPEWMASKIKFYHPLSKDIEEINEEKN